MTSWKKPFQTYETISRFTRDLKYGTKGLCKALNEQQERFSTHFISKRPKPDPKINFSWWLRKQKKSSKRYWQLWLTLTLWIRKKNVLFYVVHNRLIYNIFHEQISHAWSFLKVLKHNFQRHDTGSKQTICCCLRNYLSINKKIKGTRLVHCTVLNLRGTSTCTLSDGLSFTKLLTEFL